MTKQTQDPARNVKMKPKIQVDQITAARRDVEIIKGTAMEASTWVHAVANFEINAAGYNRLLRVNALLGSQATEVTKVHAVVKTGTSQVYIWPADEGEEDDVYAVNRINSSAWINLFDLLYPLGIKIETGYRERYAVKFAPEDAVVTPALLVDLAEIKERKTEPRRKPQSKKAKAQAKPAPVEPNKEPAKASEQA